MKMVEKTLENAKKCLCMTCPSYTEECKKTMPDQMPDAAKFAALKHFEGLYCAFGKSGCIIKENGCVCSKCSVHSDNKLKSGYFCVRGMQM